VKALVEATPISGPQDARALLFGFTRRSQGISGFARLRDGDEQVVFLNQWISIPKLTADIDLHRRSDHLLKKVLADQPRVPARATGHYPNLPDFGELFWRQPDIRQVGFAALIGIAAADGI
jgi:hypothetical protein